MSRRTSDADNDRFVTLFNEAFQELQDTAPDFANIFLSELIQEGFSSPMDLDGEERLYRLIYFFEYYILQIPINILSVLKDHRLLNDKFEPNKISDVRFTYGINNNGEELSVLLSALRINQEQIDNMKQTFADMLDSGDVKHSYESFKNKEGSKEYEFK